MIGHSDKTLKDCIPFNRGRLCCCKSWPRSVTEATGDPGRGDWKLVCVLPGVEGGPAALVGMAVLSSCSRTTFSICSKSSWIRVRNGWTLSCSTFGWCRMTSEMILTHNVALSSLSFRTSVIKRSTTSLAYCSKGSAGVCWVGRRWRISRMQCRSFWVQHQHAVYQAQRVQLTCSNDVFWNMQGPRSILIIKGITRERKCE